MLFWPRARICGVRKHRLSDNSGMIKEEAIVSRFVYQGAANTPYRYLVLLCVSLSSCTSAMSMTGLSPLLVTIAHDLNIQIGAATNLLMAYVLANAVFLTWGGVVCDRYGITAALVSGLLCTCVPAVLMPSVFAREFHMLLVLRLIQGASMGFIFATVGHVLLLWFPLNERGVAGGLMIGATPIGAAVGVIAAPYLLEVTGSWRHAMALLSIPGWVGIALTILIARRSPPRTIIMPFDKSAKPAQKKMTVLYALTRQYTWIGVGIVFCNAYGLFCLYNLVPLFLAANAPVGVGLPPMMAGNLSLTVPLTGFFAMIAGGIFFDKAAKGNYRVAMVIGFCLTAIAVFFILVPDVHTRIPPLVFCLLIGGWGIPFMNASISSCIVDNYPAPIIGRMMGVWFGLGTFGGAIGIYMGGISIDKTGSFYWAIMQIALTAAMGIIFSMFLKFENIATRESDYAT